MFKEKLMEAFEKKNNDVNNFVWKYAKDSNRSQKEIKLMDATPEELKQFYNHCESMLNSQNRHNPGRYVILNMIKEQRKKCNIELYLRKLGEGSLTGGNPYSKHMYCQDILECIQNNRETFPQSELSNIPISAITKNVPSEYAMLSIQDVITGCLDGLGTINMKHLTFNFIINMGLCLTADEIKEFTVKDENGKVIDRRNVIKKYFNFNSNVDLKMKQSGLTFSEFRAIINLYYDKFFKKYSALTTEQLLVLRNKVLLKLEQEINRHIESWERRKNQIKKVCEVKDINLK